MATGEWSSTMAFEFDCHRIMAVFSQLLHSIWVLSSAIHGERGTVLRLPQHDHATIPSVENLHMILYV